MNKEQETPKKWSAEDLERVAVKTAPIDYEAAWRELRGLVPRQENHVYLGQVMDDISQKHLVPELFLQSKEVSKWIWCDEIDDIHKREDIDSCNRIDGPHRHWPLYLGSQIESGEVQVDLFIRWGK